MVTTDFGEHWVLRHRGIARATASVVLHEGTTSTLYASTGREFFASRDAGDTWTTFRADAGSHPMPAWVASAIAAGEPRIVYASTWGILGGLLGRNGIWRTLDEGETWQLVDVPSHGVGRCCRLMADPNDRDTVYAIVAGVGIGGEGDLIRRTTDGGLTWAELPIPGLALSLTASPTVPTTLLAQVHDVTHAGRFVLLTSIDRGDHWIRAGAGLPLSVPITNIVTDTRRPARLFAGTNGRGVFRSVDAGATWRPTGRLR